MKTLIPNLFIALAWLVLPMVAQAQFSFTTNNGAITITGYNSAAGLNMFIPAATNGYPVTTIGDYAFEYSIITNVSIPDSITNIGIYAFSECPSLTSVTIPNSVTSLGYAAFAGCTSLMSATIGTGVTNIGDFALNDCANLTNIAVNATNPVYSSLGGVLFDKAKATLIQFPAGLGGSYPVTNSVTSIGDYAFDSCIRLTSVTIPNSVISIGEEAFAICTNLTSVTIGTGVTNIGNYAFGYCISLTSATIPDSVTIIGVEAFVSCYSLTNATIGNGVTSIGEETFFQCTSLTSVTIGNSVTNLGFFAFGFCTNLQSAYFLGNAPPDDGTAFANDSAVVYYLYGTTGWGPTFGGVPAVLWNPQAHALSFTGGHFGFNLTGPTNAIIVVESCTNLAHAVWLPIATNTFSASGTSTFSDLQSGSYPIRFYRVRSP